MTRSIFDPTGGETEHSGNRNMGPRADNISHMPTDVVDGEVSDAEVAEHDAATNAEQKTGGTMTEADGEIRFLPPDSDQSRMPSV